MSNCEVLSPVSSKVAEIPEIAVMDLVLQQLSARLPALGQQPWLIDVTSGSEVRFCEVEPQTLRVASALSRRGFKQGDVLYHVTIDKAQLYVVLLAVWRLGGITRGWYHADAPDEFARQIKELRPRFVLVDAETWPSMREASTKLVWPLTFLSVGKVAVPGATAFSQLLQDDGSGFPTDVKINPREDVLTIIGTSGSTGAPKSVLHTHYAAVALVIGTSDYFDMGSSFMSGTANFSIGNLRLTLMSLMKGCTVYTVGKYTNELFFDYLKKYKPEVVMMYPYLACWLARHPHLESSDLSFLRAIWMGAWVLDPATVALFASRLPRVKIGQVYGMTETMLITSTDVRENLDTDPSMTIKIVQNEGSPCVSTGRLLPNVKCKVVEAGTGRELGRGQRGEILVQSPCLMKGYLHLQHVGIDADGWLHTGDVGFVDSDGHVFVVERLNFTFKYQTAPVSPSEIEAVLQQHAAVQSAGVVAIPNPVTDNLARAFVVLRPACSATAGDLENYVAQRLPAYKHLHGGVRFVDKLPENRGGKLDRGALKKIALLEG